MGKIFEDIPYIKYGGADSREPLSFKFYDPDRIILGKPMREHLPFAMAWWHNLCATGADMFGRGTADKSFGAAEGTMEHARAKVDAGFEFMQKLGIKYFCFHDVDLVPEADDIKITNNRLDEISNGVNIVRSRICGGGAKSGLWRSIIADVLNVPVEIPEVEEGPAYGAAILAMTACGVYENVSEACAKITRVKGRVLPDVAAAENYSKRYKTFRRLYPALKGVYENYD